MKKLIPSGIKHVCRLSLKLGSAFFLLFFTVFAPAAPVIAQVGSAVFIFLLIILSPFSNDKAPTADSPENGESQQFYCQLDDDLPIQDVTTLHSSQRKNQPLPTVPVAKHALDKKLLLLQQLTVKICTYTEKKPEEYYSLCQPVRAGPATFLV